MRFGCSCSCVAFVLLAAVAAGRDGPVGSRVRPTDDRARRLLAIGEQESSTLRYLVAALEASDLIVLVSVEPATTWSQSVEYRYHGSTRLLGAAGGQRYVAIWLDSLWPRGSNQQRARLALLAHELQHAVEIARSPGVLSQAGMISLFERIGRQVSRNKFETDAALAIESRVCEELSAAFARPQTR